MRGEDEHERRLRTVVRKDFWAPSSNKQLNFVQHVVSMLKEGGRAAVVVPDNVLSEGGAGEAVRRRLLEECDVHTLLRLPTGIFYAPGVKANVLFFDRRRTNGSGRTLWVYDLRTGMNFRLKTNPLRRSDLADFVERYRVDGRKDRQATWSPANKQGRWRAFNYDELVARDKCSWDLAWLHDDGGNHLNPSSRPRHLLSAMVKDLRSAVEQLEGIAAGLSNKH